MVGVLKIVFGLMLLIGIHELGHAVAAWLCGVKTKRFSIGMGPGITFKKVPFFNELILSPIVLGGYVLLDDEVLAEKGLWQKWFVLTGGMLANVLLAIPLLVFSGQADLLRAIYVSFFLWLCGWPFLIHVLASGKVAPHDALSGPVGIGNMLVSHTYPYSFTLATISLGLAMFNLLPLPPLDGGLMLIALLEKIVGKERARTVHGILQTIGLVIILGIFVFATINDISKLNAPK